MGRTHLWPHHLLLLDHQKNVAPGKYVYSDYCTIPDRSEVDKLCVAIKKYVYTDGDIVEIDDEDLKYWEWDVSWN